MVKGKKKVFMLVLAGFSLVLSSCTLVMDQTTTSTTGEVSDYHEHTYSDQWSYDDYYHWHDATCGHNVSSSHFRHEFSDTVIEGSCEEEGLIIHSCVVCGYVYREHTTDPTGHDYQKSTVIETSCTQDGMYLYVCSRCGKSYTETEPAYGHNYIKSTITETGCVVDGYFAYTCSRCGDVYYESEPAYGHDYIQTVLKEATCGAAGKGSLTCSRCDLYEEYEIPATGAHTYTGAGVIVTAPTCEGNGEIDYTCDICGYLLQTYTEPLGHEYSEMEYDENHHWDYCLRCGDTLDDEPHTFSPSYSSDGNYHYHLCTVCGAKDKEVRHTYGDDDYCTTCGYWFPYNYILDDDNMSCTITGFRTNTTDVTIPSNYGDYTVTTLANYRDVSGVTYETILTNARYVKYLTIPSTVTRIGNFAFNNANSGASALRSVTFESPGLLEIGQCAFQSSNLETFSIPGTVKSIGQNAFSGTNLSGTLYIPDSVTELGSYAFASISDITRVIIGSGVSEIPYCCFYFDKGVTEYVFRGNPTAISAASFYFNSGLTSLILPEGVETISSYAFGDCRSLNWIVLPSTINEVGLASFKNDNLNRVYSLLTDPLLKDEIVFGDDNDDILKANWFYYSDYNLQDGYNHWHYEDDTPTPWYN